MTDAVLVENVAEGITQLTLNRPERLNAMNYALVSELYSAFDALSEDRSCRVIVLTGAGRGFCAGLDLSEGASPPKARRSAVCWQPCGPALVSSPSSPAAVKSLQTTAWPSAPTPRC